MYDLGGKKALITAGAGGLGSGFADALLRNGVEKVAILDLDEGSGNKLVKKLNAEYGSGRVHMYKCDVADKEDLETVFGKIVTDLGGLDIVLNNSGVVDFFDLEKSVNITLTSLLRVMELANKYIGKQNGKKGGVVVNTASILGLDSARCNPIYTACKHGVIGLTKSYGTQYNLDKSNIRVMGICPGVTWTELVRQIFEPKFTEEEKEFAIEQAEWPTQEVNVVADTLIHMLTEGTHGSFWVIEESEMYEIEFPRRKQLKKRF